jgi:hypothetical protein
LNKLKGKISSSVDLVIRQEEWHESPCSNCSGAPCCGNLPLVPLRLERQSDFINLILASCYNGIYPAMKKSGEWTIYLGRNCRYLDNAKGKCSIHKAPDQSMICKSYDAHNCWYIDAFCTGRFTTMIPFNTDMLIWFEKRYSLISSGFDTEIDWRELCGEAHEFRRNTLDLSDPGPKPWTGYSLPFRKSRADSFLFLPPYQRPEHINHFELISFRLGFPGVYLAITDTCWAYMVRTGLSTPRLDMVRKNYYPAIDHKDFIFSFAEMAGEQCPFSETGEQWIILQRSNLKLLKAMTVFDSSGRVRRLPGAAEVLDVLKSIKPDRAA